MATFNPEHGYLNFGFKSCFAFEQKRYYNQVFKDISHPLSFETFSSEEEHPPRDCRFYLNLRAPAGFTFKIEIVDGGKVSSLNRELPFPKLTEIIRYQHLQTAEQDALRRVNQSLFNTSRERFLERVFWPETANHILHLDNRHKVATQLAFAKAELASRSKEPPSTSVIDTSFSNVSTDQLQKVVGNATKFLQSGYPRSDVEL